MAVKYPWVTRNSHNHPIGVDCGKMEDQQHTSDSSKQSFSNGAISQHINRLHQKAQLSQTQQKSSTTSNSDVMCASPNINLSSSQMTSRPQSNNDPFSPSTNMTQQQNDLSQQHSLQHRIGRTHTNDQAGNSRRASDPVRVLDGKTYYVAGHMTQSSRHRSGSYNQLSNTSSNNTRYDQGTSYNSSNSHNMQGALHRHVSTLMWIAYEILMNIGYFHIF